MSRRIRKSNKRRKSIRKSHKRHKSIRKSNKRRKSIKKTRSRRRYRNKKDGMNGIQLYNNPSILPSLPLGSCYKDPRVDFLTCKYKLTDESNPFLITFPGSDKFYKDIEKTKYNDYLYDINLNGLFKTSGLTLKTFIVELLKPGFGEMGETIYYDYNYDDIEFLKSFIDSDKKLFDNTEDNKLILSETLSKKRYDVTCLLVNNYPTINSSFDNKHLKILSKPKPEIEEMFQKVLNMIDYRIKLYRTVKPIIDPIGKFMSENPNLVITLITFFSLFLFAKNKGLIFNKNLANSIDSNSNYIPKLLIYLGADVNNDRFITPLCKAVNVNNIEMVKFLIKKGANVNNICNEYESTPLTYAIYNNNFEIVKLLVENGANINYIKNDGTPLYKVMMRTRLPTNINVEKSIEIGAYLIYKGADVNFRSQNGLTARNFNPEIYDRMERIATERTKIDIFETITTSFVKKDREPLSSKTLEEMELPEAVIEYLKATGVEPDFVLDEMLKFLDYTQE
jgi:hypothetical protein